MRETVEYSMITIKLRYLMVKWEGIITAVVALCGILAILSGIVWLAARKNSLLVALLGLSSCYLLGKNFWRFRDKEMPLEH